MSPELKEHYKNMTVKEALQVILNDIKHYGTSLKWAINYVKAASCMEEGSEELRVQCLYILSNLEHWTVKQNPLARSVKDVLRRGAKR
jgi:hypothetical protein